MIEKNDIKRLKPGKFFGLLPIIPWKPDLKEKHVNNIDNYLQSCPKDEKLDKLKDVIRLAANYSPTPRSPIANCKAKFRNPWFDNECLKARKKSLAGSEALKILRKQAQV